MNKKKIGAAVAVSLVAAIAILWWRQDEKATASADVASNGPNIASQSRGNLREADAANPLVNYRPTSDTSGSIALDELYARGLPKTAKTVELAGSF